MNLEFLQDYTGRETGMKSYKKGDRDTFPFALAWELVNLGVAKEIDEVMPPIKSKKSEVVKTPEATDDKN